MITTIPQTGYAPVNGLNLYYEIHGSGAPLVVLHGGFGSTGTLGTLLPALAAHRRVIAVDLQGHGRTADIDRPIRSESLADDIAALIAYLGLGTASIMGYSFGGKVALQAAIRHPERIDRLVVVSAAWKDDSIYPALRENMAQINAATGEAMKQTPMYQAHASVAPRPDDWPALWEKIGESMRRDYDWSADVAALAVPTMLVLGDADNMSPARAAEFFALLGGGQQDGSWDRSGVTPHRLAILPGTTHYEIIASPLLPLVVTPFLNEAASAGR